MAVTAPRFDHMAQRRTTSQSPTAGSLGTRRPGTLFFLFMTSNQSARLREGAEVGRGAQRPGIVLKRHPATRNRTRDHLMSASSYSQVLDQLSCSRPEMSTQNVTLTSPETRGARVGWRVVGKNSRHGRASRSHLERTGSRLPEGRIFPRHPTPEKSVL